jgi:hypothetical protein
MKKIELLRKQRDTVCSEINNLTELLVHFERPINILLVDKNRHLRDLSVSEKLQITNLLIEMFEEVKHD